MEGSRSLPSIAVRVLLRSAACACVAAATVAGCTYYQTVPVAPSGPGTFDRSWNAALGAADDLGVSVTSANRTSGIIYGTTPTDTVTISVLTQADGRVRVEFNVKSPAGDDTDLVNRLSRAYEARMGR
jgi:hypothetical protein